MIVLNKAYSRLRRSLLVSLFSLAIVSCGAAIVTSGISGTGIVVGTVTAFGSIWVNGVEYNIDNASFDVNGAALSGVEGQNQLSIGMVVKLQATDNGDGTGVATTVVYDASIKGPILTEPAVPVSGNTNLKEMTVVGQTVVISKISTKFEGGIDFSTIKMNDIVEVSGFVDAQGAIKATLVKKEGEYVPGMGTEIELHGVISNLDTVNQSFMLNNQPANFNDATELKKLTTLADGLQVEVKGVYQADNSVLVSQIKLESSEKEEIENSTGEVRLQGLVSALDEVNFTFTLEGVTVDYSKVNAGSTAGLVDGVRVEIRGEVTNGVLVLTRLEVDNEEDNSGSSD